LAQSDAPDQFASSAGLTYVDGAVRVVVELADTSQFSPDSYGLAVEAQYENLLQAMAPVDQLCPMAADPSVTFVRPPARASVVGGDQPGNTSPHD
jgi:hypothetical protein